MIQIIIKCIGIALMLLGMTIGIRHLIDPVLSKQSVLLGIIISLVIIIGGFFIYKESKKE